MRFTPPVLALSLAIALTASASYTATAQALDPRARALLGAGQAALAAGRVDDAVDSYEAALAVQPGNPQILVSLAEATRRQGMQGKALHYYRDALVSDPRNLTAISGEGAALAEKGATEKARRNLARLQGLCGGDCAQTRDLTAAIARGAVPRVAAATTTASAATAVSEN